MNPARQQLRKFATNT